VGVPDPVESLAQAVRLRVARASTPSKARLDFTRWFLRVRKTLVRQASPC
jgi:hypothetical protein